MVIEGLTLANGKTTGASSLSGTTPHTASGGAIRSMTAGQLTINDATIRDSGTTGMNARGGGVFAVGPDAKPQHGKRQHDGRCRCLRR